MPAVAKAAILFASCARCTSKPNAARKQNKSLNVDVSLAIRQSQKTKQPDHNQKGKESQNGERLLHLRDLDHAITFSTSCCAAREILGCVEELCSNGLVVALLLDVNGRTVAFESLKLGELGGRLR